MTPLVPAAARLRAGEPTPAAYVERLCAEVDRIDPGVRAFVPEAGRYHRIVAAARRLEARHPDPAGRPPLYGVPVGVTDVVRVDGLPTHAGSAVPPGALAGPEASLVGRLRAAGALVAGKTATAEFAVVAPGPTRNPHDLAYSPGGPGAGSAAAVAAGFVPLAIGVQTAGAVILPSAYCGAVGFCPTRGRIPVDGVVAHVPALAAPGCHTADVAGAALAASVLCEGWRPATPAGPPVLGVPAGAYAEQAGPDALAEFERAVGRLGLPVVRLDPVGDAGAVRHHLRTVARYELAQAHADLFARFGGLYRPETVAVIRHGRETDPADHAAALAVRADFRRRLAALTAEHGVDVWVAPAATGPAPRGLGSSGSAAVSPAMSLPWSFAGVPVVTLPAGTSGGLPVGLQCVGAEGADEVLLAHAAVIEERLAA